MNSARHTSAYTLIEILVTLTIIGILFGFGYVSYRGFSRRQQLAGISKQMQGDFRLAQQMALSGQKPNDPACTGTNSLIDVEVRIGSLDNPPLPTQYLIMASCSGGVVVVKTVDLPVGITATSTVSPIAFKVLGQGTNLVSAPAAITLNQTANGVVINTAMVTVSSGGEIY